jgi:hypothetical protein
MANSRAGPVSLGSNLLASSVLSEGLVPRTIQLTALTYRRQPVGWPSQVGMDGCLPSLAAIEM